MLCREAGDGDGVRWDQVREAVDVRLNQAGLKASVGDGSTAAAKRATEKARETWGLSPAQIARAERAERLLGGEGTE